MTSSPSSGIGLAGQPLRPCLAREAQDLGADELVVLRGPLLQFLVRQVARQRVAQLRREKRRTQPTVALGARQDFLLEPAAEFVDGLAWLSPQPT